MKNPKRAERDRAALEYTVRCAVRQTRAILLPKDHPEYDPDGEVTWGETSFRMRAALELTKSAVTLEAARTKAGAGKVRSIGLVILPARSRSIEEWEAAVKARNAIDAVGVPVDTTAGPALLTESEPPPSKDDDGSKP